MPTADATRTGPATAAGSVPDVVQVRPFDRYRCGGCHQLLTFDERGFVPPEQLRACLGRCDWSLVERDGHAVPDAPGPAGELNGQSDAVGST